MSQIVLENISKVFKIRERSEGKFGLVTSTIMRKTKEVKALDDITFKINEGELVGYIGPNGAGKSTTVKIMSGILTPEYGKCEIMGRIPWKDRVNHVSKIGVVFGQRSQLWWDVPVNDSFDLLKDIYDIPIALYRERLKKLIETMDIGCLLKTPVRQLSLGQRMRCEVVASLLHSPKILFLDEPTIGLDAISKLSLRDFLKNENYENGITMILTTHDMNDIEALCHRVMVIGHGKLLFDGNLDSLKRQFSPLRCIRAITEKQINKIQIIGAVKIDVVDRDWTVWFDPSKFPAHRIVADMAERLPLVDIMIEEQDIDEMIAAMYQEMDL